MFSFVEIGGQGSPMIPVVMKIVLSFGHNTMVNGMMISAPKLPCDIYASDQ